MHTNSILNIFIWLHTNVITILIYICKGTGTIKIQKFFITDEFKVKVISEYVATIEPEERIGNPHLWRKICGPDRAHRFGQNIGHNTTSEWGKVMARRLGIDDWEKYTGHCFRRTGATQIADNGASIIQIMQRGNWRSSTVAEGYVAESNSGNMTIAGLLELDKRPPSTSSAASAGLDTRPSDFVPKRCASPSESSDNGSVENISSKRGKMTDDIAPHYHFHVMGNGNSFVIGSPPSLPGTKLSMLPTPIPVPLSTYEFRASQAMPLTYPLDDDNEEHIV